MHKTALCIQASIHSFLNVKFASTGASKTTLSWQEERPNRSRHRKNMQPSHSEALNQSALSAVINLHCCTSRSVSFQLGSEAEKHSARE